MQGEAQPNLLFAQDYDFGKGWSSSWKFFWYTYDRVHGAAEHSVQTFHQDPQLDTVSLR